MSVVDGAGLTYPEVGATRGHLPTGYQHLDRQRTIGQGTATFERTARRLMSWGVQRGAGLAVQTEADAAQVGTVLTVRLRFGPLVVNAPCRVVYVVEEPRRVGFAYGTLAGHPESGEELFLIEHRPDDSVVLSIRAFSRPARWFSRVAGPLAHLAQRLVTDRYLRALDGE